MNDIDVVTGDAIDLALRIQPVGLLINFAGATLTEGLRRVVNITFPPGLRVSA